MLSKINHVYIFTIVNTKIFYIIFQRCIIELNFSVTSYFFTKKYKKILKYKYGTKNNRVLIRL